MICQKCKSAAASICITQVVDDKKTDIYLCQLCANRNDAAKLQEAFGFFDMMPGHLVFGADHRRVMPQTDVERCAECGITFAEIQKSGKLGCANCYNVFRVKLRPIITRIHRSAQHRGKSPSGASSARGQDADAGADAMSGGGPEPDGTVKAYAAGGELMAESPSAAESTATAEKPANAESPSAAEKRLEALKAELVNAVNEEEYEKAAELRDQIKAIESNL